MAAEDAPEVGPGGCVVVAFPGSTFKGEIAPALKDLVDVGTVDVLELNQLPGDELAAFDIVDGEVDELLTEEDLAELAELVPVSDSVLLVSENTWAPKVAAAVQRADGQVIFHDRIAANQMQAATAALPS